MLRANLAPKPWTLRGMLHSDASSGLAMLTSLSPSVSRVKTHDPNRAKFSLMENQGVNKKTS